LAVGLAWLLFRKKPETQPAPVMAELPTFTPGGASTAPEPTSKPAQTPTTEAVPTSKPAQVPTADTAAFSPAASAPIYVDFAYQPVPTSKPVQRTGK
jgi:hypothetical protein